MAINDIFTDERQLFKDSETGREYTRLTKTGRNKHLYLYVNSFDNEGRIIYVSDRNGYLNYYRMDLDSGVSTQLTDETEINAAGLAWHNKTNKKLVFWSGKKIRMLDLASMECGTIINYPTYGGYLTMTADAKYVLTYYDLGSAEDRPGGQTKHVGPWGIFAIPTDPSENIETSSGIPVLEFLGRINHIQASPTDPELIEYCWEGNWKNLHRMWITNRIGTDGGVMGLQKPNEARGHEFWFDDGSKMGYHGSIFEKGETIGMIGTVTKDGCDDWRLTLEAVCGHCNYHAGRDLWVTDKAGDYNGLAFIRIVKGGSNVIGSYEKLCLHNSTWKTQGCHPHMQFSPDGNKLLWTSDGEGISQIYSM